MPWLLASVVVLGLGAVAVVASGRVDRLEPVRHDLREVSLPAGPLGAADLRRTKFPVVLRGYRMSDVDALLERLARQFDADADPDHPAD